MRKELENLTIIYNNVRGFKSKVDSIEAILQELGPTIFCAVETHLDKKEDVKIEGYEVKRLDGTANSGGILVAIKDTIKTVVVEIIDYTEVGQIKWLKITNTKVTITLGVIYAPQEKVTPNKELKKMYEEIERRVSQAQQDKSIFLLIGDFNCKIGNRIEGNSDTVTKGGRLLQKMALKNDLQIVNTTEKTKGLWTRVEGKKRSVIDYVMITREDSQLINKLTIDEEKEYAIYYKEKQKTIYTDHNTMILEMEVEMQGKGKRDSKVITRKDYLKYNQEILNQKVSNIFTVEGDLQQQYNTWSKVIEENIEKVKRKIKKNPRRDERMLIKIIKSLRKELRAEKEEEERKFLKKRIVLTREHLTNLKSRIRGERLRKRVERIRRNDKIGIWEIKRKIKNKGYTQRQITNDKGKIITDQEEILKEYERYYKDLLQTKKATTEKEREIEVKVEEAFTALKEEAEQRHEGEMITMADVRKGIKLLKWKKAPDRQGWRGEWLKNGGEEMERSLCKLFNKMEQEIDIPSQWKTMLVRSIDKKGKGNNLKDTQRGIFLTNMVSKVYEKVKKVQNERYLDNMSEMQMAGRMGYSTMDNIIIVSAIIKDNKERKKPTYLLFGDAEKCFDKLWLKDSILELAELGVSAKDAMMIYKMNEEATLVVKTPVGNTEEIQIRDLVRQGSIYGPTLCCVSTAKVNDIGEEVKESLEEIQIGMLIFMDDINSTSKDAENIKRAIRNCRALEEQKKFTFGLDKTKYMIIDADQNTPLIEESVQKGTVKRTKEYRYVGIHMNEMGNLYLHIQKKRESCFYIYREIMAMGSPRETGSEFVKVRLELFQKCLVKALIYGVHAWTISEEEVEAIGQIQSKYLKLIMELPQSTPTAALYNDTGIWPVKEHIQYLTAMLYYGMMKKENRVATRILKMQERKIVKDSVTERLSKMLTSIGKSIEDAKKEEKSVWKRTIKKSLSREIEKRLANEMKDKTKSRLIYGDKFKRKRYLKEESGTVALDILKIRTNMIELKANYRSRHEEVLCHKCKKSEDKVEHVIKCYADIEAKELKDLKSSRWKLIIKTVKKSIYDSKQDF